MYWVSRRDRSSNSNGVTFFTDGPGGPWNKYEDDRVSRGQGGRGFCFTIDFADLAAAVECAQLMREGLSPGEESTNTQELLVVNAERAESGRILWTESSGYTEFSPPEFRAILALSASPALRSRRRI